MANESSMKEIPIVEGVGDISDINIAEAMFGPKYDQFDAQTTRRFIKSHLPIEIMPQSIFDVGAKLIYVARNPKDVAVSYYHFHKVNPVFGFTGDFDDYMKYFLDDKRELILCFSFFINLLFI